jgi:hypothetical protein
VFSINSLTIALSLLLLVFISYNFLHLLSTNHKCTHLCYFPLLLKLLLRRWIRDELFQGVLLEASDCLRSIVCGVVVPFHWCVFKRFSLVFWKQYYCKSLYYIYCDIDYFCNTLLSVCVETCSWIHIRWTFGFGSKIGCDIIACFWEAHMEE